MLSLCLKQLTLAFDFMKVNRLFSAAPMTFLAVARSKSFSFSLSSSR